MFPRSQIRGTEGSGRQYPLRWFWNHYWATTQNMGDTGAGPRLMERGAQESSVFSSQRECRSQTERGGLGDFSGWRMQASYGEEQARVGLKKTEVV